MTTCYRERKKIKPMSYVSDDRNYTDNTQSGIDAPAERVGDIRGGCQLMKLSTEI